jgi:hypothetical protein
MGSITSLDPLPAHFAKPKIDIPELLRDNLGIKRVDMPQIQAAKVPEFLEGLRHKGISVTRGTMPVASVKSTQSELHEDNIRKLIEDPEASKNLTKPVIVSESGHLLDGHHRWAALKTVNPKATISVIKVHMLMNDLLREARDFHGVEYKKADEPDNDFYDFTESIFERDERVFKRVKEALKERGYFESDFEEGGALYGWSTNELLDMARDQLEKAAGPFIGPRGGKWADPEHTQHWEPEQLRSAFESLMEKYGGKVKPHESDPNKWVVKIPVEKAKYLTTIKQKYGLEDEIKLGAKYAILSVPKFVFHSVKQPAPVTKPPSAPVAVQEEKSGKALVPPYSKHEWKEHASVEEAKSWAEKQGIGVAYEDVATGNQLNHAIAEQHPWIKRHVEFLGTAHQLRQWAEQHPDINKRAMTEAKHPQDLRKFSLGGSAIAIAHPTTAKPYSQSVIAVADSWGTAEAYDKHKGGMSSGFTMGTELADTVRHEFGHVEGFVFRHLYPKGKEGPSCWEIWKKHCVAQLKSNPHGVMKEISQYGATNPHECWAEVSVMRRRGMPLPQWVHDAVDEMQIDKTSWEKMGKIWSES